MNEFTLPAMAIVMIAYIAITQFYFRKHLNIKIKWIGPFSKGRKTPFIAIDLFLILAFFVFAVILGTSLDAFPNYQLTLIMALFVLFFLLSINRGVEQWLYHRSEKAYYHEWATSLTLLLMFLIIIMEEWL